ncbi:MAG: cytochrome C oxidase subunit IV family protein [Planctomycetota bacterium]
MSTHAAHAGPDAEAHHAHVAPLWVMFGVFAALLVLTGLTVAAISIDLGQMWNVILALSIAVVKALLVAAFFMHLWWDKPFNAYLLAAAVVFVALMLAYILVDTDRYSDVVGEGDGVNALQRAAP